MRSAMPVFVHCPASASLCVCADETEALALTADSNEELLYFAGDGEPLRCSILPDGRRYLRPWAACGSCRLEQVLPLVGTISGREGLTDLAAVRAYLSAQRRAHHE